MRVQSIKAFPRRMQQPYSFSDVHFKTRRRRLVVILNAAEWSPAGSHVIVKFKAPRQRDRQRRRR
jgi:hypothetical protein